MKPIKPLFCLLFISIILISCESSLTQHRYGENVVLKSEKKIYSSNEQVILHLYNETNDVLYLNYCGPTLLYELDQKNKGNWTPYSGGACLAMYLIKFTPSVKPGETKTINLHKLEVGEYQLNLPYKLTSTSSETDTLIAKFYIQ